MSNKYYFVIGNKKHEYVLTPKSSTEDGEIIHVFCPVLNINQDFLKEDIPNLILDFPNIYEAKIKHRKHKNAFIKFRVSEQEKFEIEHRAEKKGFSSTSDYLRNLALT